MTDTPTRFEVEPSPPARRMTTPSWFDLRLVAGVVLVLASVLLGASVLSSADHRQPRWALSHDLAAGTVLTGADVHPVRVQLGAADQRYLPVSEAVIGRTVRDGGRAGELLLRAELTSPAAGVSVTVALPPQNGPAVARGDRVTLWLSTKSCQAAVLLSGDPVQSVTKVDTSTFSSGGGSVLALTVPASQAKLVVAALDLPGAVIRAGVLSAGQPPDQPVTDLTRCGGTGA